jgi:hypothetical protein
LCISLRIHSQEAGATLLGYFAKTHQRVSGISANAFARIHASAVSGGYLGQFVNAHHPQPVWAKTAQLDHSTKLHIRSRNSGRTHCHSRRVHNEYANFPSDSPFGHSFPHSLMSFLSIPRPPSSPTQDCAKSIDM